MGCLGLEPRTIRLKAEYSTIELATLFPLMRMPHYMFKVNLNHIDFLFIKIYLCSQNKKDLLY